MNIKFIALILSILYCRSLCRWLFAVSNNPENRNKQKETKWHAPIILRIFMYLILNASAFVPRWLCWEVHLMWDTPKARPSHSHYPTAWFGVEPQGWECGWIWSPTRARYQQGCGVQDTTLSVPPASPLPGKANMFHGVYPEPGVKLAVSAGGWRGLSLLCALLWVPGFPVHNLLCLCQTIPSLAAWRLTACLVPVFSA